MLTFGCLLATKRLGVCLGLTGLVLTFAQAQADTLSLGLGVSHLTYREPSLAVTHKAWLPTLQGEWTPKGLEIGSWPISLAGQIAYGQGDYAGTGTMRDQPIQLYQLQVQSRHLDWLDGFRFTPAVGYRHFYNDARGFTSTGAQGYRRTSEYVFASLGLEQFLADNWRWSVNYRYLLAAQQRTQLGDVRAEVGQLGMVKNKQRRGFGLNVGVCKTLSAWDLCPSFEYWRIADSDTESRRLNGDTYLLTEPKNTTQTFQLLLHYKFKD